MKLTPSCTISILFNLHPRPVFTYFGRSVPSIWGVSASGNINPCSRSRIIRFQLESHPAGAEFKWIHVGLSPLACANQEAHSETSGIKVCKISATEMIIDFDAAPSGTTFWYSPRITLDGSTYSDDPKIYNPPDD